MRKINSQRRVAAGPVKAPSRHTFPRKPGTRSPPPLSSSVGGTPTVTPQYLIYVPYDTYKPSTCSHPFFVDEATILCRHLLLAAAAARPSLNANAALPSLAFVVLAAIVVATAVGAIK